MKHIEIDELVRVVTPLKRATNKGSVRAWQQLKKEAALPDWLFPFFHTYGSGAFAGFDAKGGFLDYLGIMNVFEKPFLKPHRAMGQFFTMSNEISHLPVSFFPATQDGLFPIIKTDQAMFVLVDPTDERKVYITDNHLCFFEEKEHTYIEYLSLLFRGKRSELWSIPEGASVSKTIHYGSIREASRIGRADYYP